ncbi:hypothetical protein CHUAL_004392 [Chamberlinius hualienensis]
MPYLLVSTQVRLESGPTNLGDESVDPQVVSHLQAKLVKDSHYVVAKPPRIVLNELEKIGFKVVTSCGVGQTCVWTLHKND